MMALTKRSPCYCSTVLAIAIIVLTLLAMRGIMGGVLAELLVIILAALVGISSVTGYCCNCLGKGEKSEQSGSCCQPPSQSTMPNSKVIIPK